MQRLICIPSRICFASGQDAHNQSITLAAEHEGLNLMDSLLTEVCTDLRDAVSQEPLLRPEPDIQSRLFISVKPQQPAAVI